MRLGKYSRREWLSVMIVCASSFALRADDLSGFYYRSYSKCLPEFLASLAEEAYRKRKAQLERLQTPSEIHGRQQWARDSLWSLIGGQESRTDLNPRVMGSFERAAYRVEKVIYQSRPGTIISANVYYPKIGQAPYPGVLFQMGHAVNGKAYASYQKCCQGLVQLGYVVLAFDPMGQGERIEYPDASGRNSRLGSATAEHDLPGKQMLLLGDSASRYQLWDAIRSLDYLASLEAVDTKRLASTGQSGGGTLTMLLACADERLSAAAVSSGNTEDFACAHFIAPGSTDDAEQDFIGSGPAGFDRWDLLYPIAPKPLLVEVSAHDSFGTYSPNYLLDGREQFESLRRMYKVLGHPDRLSWNSTPLPHGLTYSLRLQIYNWFEKWLKHSDRAIETEPPVAPEVDRQLWVGPTGNVVRDFHSVRCFDRIRKEALSLNRSATRKDWTDAVPVSPPSPELQFRKLSTVPLDGARVSAIEINPEAQVWLPAWLFMPAQGKEISSCLMVLDDRGRNAEAHEDGLYHQLARKGLLVCALDVRFIGDTAPDFGAGNPPYQGEHHREEDYAWASLILGRPLLAQRITDAMAGLRGLRNMPEAAGKRISLCARGRLTVPALFAFQASRDAGALYLSGGLISYRSILETEDYRQPLSNFAWNLFRCTDLPILAAESAPRPIHLAGAVDASNRRLSLKEIQQDYRSPNISFYSEPAWDLQSLGSIS